MSLFVRICSLNAHDTFDDKYDFNAWICPDTQSDIVVVGIQELTHNVKDIALGSTNLNNVTKKWLFKITFSENLKGKYETLKWSRLGSLLLVIFIKKSLSEAISNVMVGNLAAGALGMANKGCVAISFKVNTTQLCFINAHLVAGRANNLKRLDDFENIIDFLKFNSEERDSSGGDSSISDLNSDALFLFGDLNFRLQNISKAMTKKIVDNGTNYTELLKYDEYYLHKENEAYYNYFQEAPIKFMPSYKFFKASDKYNLQEKGHISYTDRIFWQGNLEVKNISYMMYPDIDFSDHRPISGTYKILPMKKSVSNIETNGQSVAVTVSTRSLNFGVVKFLEHRKVSINIENNNDRSLNIKISYSKSEIKLPKWLTVLPNNFSLPAHQIMKLNFTINIHKEDVFQFNLGQKTISAINLYLKSDTNDVIPLEIVGKYEPTFLGLPLEVLQALKFPVNKLSCLELKQLYDKVKISSTIPPSTNEPSIGLVLIYRLLTILKQKTLQVPLHQLNSIQENATDKINIRQFLDTGYMKPFIKVDFPTVFNMVLLFLEMLPTPLIPSKFKTKCLLANNNPDTILKTLNSMPMLYFKVFRRVITHVTQFQWVGVSDQLIMDEVEFLSACLEKAIFRSETQKEHNLGRQFFKFLLSNQILDKNTKSNALFKSLYRQSQTDLAPTPSSAVSLTSKSEPGSVKLKRIKYKNIRDDISEISSQGTRTS